MTTEPPADKPVPGQVWYRSAYGFAIDALDQHQGRGLPNRDDLIGKFWGQSPRDFLGEPLVAQAIEDALAGLHPRF